MFSKPIDGWLLPIEGGEFVLVSPQDFEELRKHRWKVNRAGYVLNDDRVFIHRMIMDAPAGLVVDHINGTKLDNRRSNLRICSVAENSANQHRSIYKGVSRYLPSMIVGRKGRIRSEYIAVIKINGKRTEIGRFKTASEAARAYDRIAFQLHGSAAQLNFPNELHARA